MRAHEKRNGKTYQRDIIHAEYDHALMLGSIFCDSTKVCLEDMVAIQEGHFAIGLDPNLGKDVGCGCEMNGKIIYLVLCILGDVVESSDMELEFSGFAKFSKASAKTDEVWSCDGDAQTHRGFGRIVDLVLVQPEAIGLVLAVDEVDEILALWEKVGV